jgi:drug/metabolite transporter (DMT)-like permease
MLPRGRGWLDGAAIGMMFGTEFALLYIGLIFTTASHGVLMLFTAPFFVAIGAHWLLPKEPLSWRKVAGLVLAFAGVASTLADNLTAPTPQQIVGDLLILVAGLLWGITSLYLKAVVRDRMTFAQTLFCQLAFSALLLGAVHWAVEARAIWLARPVIFAALFYQSVVVAFASYLVWFWLIQVYPVSLVSAYTFFGPIFGVLLGALAFREPLTAALLLGAAMVSGGMLLINWPASARPAASLSPA